MRGKQSVRKCVWYIGGRRRLRKRTKRGQRGKGLPIGLLVSVAAPFLGEVAKPLLKKLFVENSKKTVKQNILPGQSETPQRVCLPNGASFLARY